MRVLIFLSIFALVFGSTGYYFYNRVSHTFSGTFLTSKSFLIIYIFLLSSFILGKIFESYYINFFSETIVKIGSFTLALFLYGLIAVLFFDILRLINHFLPFYPAFIRDNMAQSRLIIGSIVGSGIILLVGFGIWNAFQPRIKNIDLFINKKVEGIEKLKVVAISDTHFGTLVSHKKAARLMSEINKLDPDLVIIAGDIIDDNIKVVKKHKLLEHFNKLTPKYGVYGIMGNHEYIGKSYTDLKYYENNNISMLIDSTVLVDNKFYIVGRDDIQSESFYSRERKTTSSIMENVDRFKPVFLLDHQPYDLQESEKAGVDLHFSGHTHHGQLWPFNYITAKIFEQDWGYLKKGNTHYYVSCGYGTAGPPVRIGSHPEIVNFNISFQK